MPDIFADIGEILEKAELEAQAEAELHMDFYRLVLTMIQEEAYKEMGLDRSSLHAGLAKNALLKTVRNSLFEVQASLGILLPQERVQHFAFDVWERISEYITCRQI